MKVENFADVWVTDFPRVPDFWWQALTKTELCAFNRDSARKYLVIGFIHNAHRATGYLAYYPETSLNKLIFLKRLFRYRKREGRCNGERHEIARSRFKLQ